jgi:hypothetical protein
MACASLSKESLNRGMKMNKQQLLPLQTRVQEPPRFPSLRLWSLLIFLGMTKEEFQNRELVELLEKPS